MRNPTGNNRRLFSRSLAAGLVLLLVLASQPGWQTGWPPTAAAAGNSELDWPKVQAINPGTPIKVVLHKDRGPRGDRKLRGRFQSATDDSLTLKMEYGPMRTLPRSSVRKVAVHYRPPKSKRDWSRVQAVAPGTPAAVVLYRDPRRIKGYFYSATDDSLTLTLKDGQRHTFSKWAVRMVLVHRPFGKRYPGWIALGGSSAILLPTLARSNEVPGLTPLLIGVSTALGFLVVSKMGVIYHVPPKHRTQPPADKPSGAESKAPGKQEDR